MKFALDILIATCIIVIGYVKADCSTPEESCSHCIAEPVSNLGATHPVGTYLKWRCEENYVMDGSSDVILWVCGWDGQWTGVQPNCTALTCPYPPIPAYGGVSPVASDQYSPGDTITYSCQDGYHLNGSVTNTCTMGRCWTNLAPTCKISQSSCGLYDVMTSPHSCIKAIRLISVDTMKWNKAKTTCRNIGGTVPGELALIKTQTNQDGVRKLLDLPGTLFEYDVDTYYWIGVKEGRNWKWSTDESNIQRLFWAAGQPSSDSGSNCISLSASEEYLWVEASCNTTHRFICQYDRICTGMSSNDAALLLDHRHKCFRFSNDDTTWFDARDTCTTEGGSLVEVVDESLQSFLTQQTSHLEDSLATTSDWWIGGYDDDTATERAWFWVDNTRASFMSWNPDEPNKTSKKCVEINSDMDHNWNDKRCNANLRAMCQIGIAACGDPGAPTHGTRSPGDRSTFLDGAVIQFYCDPGYSMEGASEITCLPDGRWDGIEPSCTVLSCDDPAPVVDNAVVTVLRRTFRETAVYTCNEASFPSGNPFSYCQANATWSQPNFECNEFTSARASTSSTTLLTTQQSPEPSTDHLKISTFPSTSSDMLSSTVPSTAYSTQYFTEGMSGQGAVTGTMDLITNDGVVWQNTSLPTTLQRLKTSDIMYPVGASIAVIIIVIVTVFCIVVLRRRHLKKSSETLAINTPTYDSIKNDYRISFQKNSRGAVGNNNDAYIGLDIGSMERLATDTEESRYMSLGQVITGRPRTGTGSSSPRGRSNTQSSTPELIAVDDEGYASLKITEVRRTHQLPYISLSHWGNSPQRRGGNISQGDMGAREGVEFDQIRSDFEANHRGSIDRSSNIYETLDTPRPSIDMGVIRKQGSLDSNDYEEIDNMDVSCSSGVDPMSSQNTTPVSKSGDIASGPSPSTSLGQLNKRETTYRKVDDPTMIFNELYDPSGSNVMNGHAAEKQGQSISEANSVSDSLSLDEKRTTTYDKVDDASLMFNNLYVSSNTITGEICSHQTDVKSVEKAAIYSTNNERIYDKVHDDVCDLHSHDKGDTLDQVNGRGGLSDLPKANLQNDTTRQEASCGPTIDRPTSYDPYYYGINPSQDTTGIDVTKGTTRAETYLINNFGKLCVEKEEENDKEKYNRNSEDVEGHAYHTLELPVNP